MKIINHCPHPISLEGADGTITTIRPKRPAVRIETRPGEYLYDIQTVPVYSASTYERIANLPEKKDGTLIVVSQICAIMINALHPERDDVVFPATAPLDFPTRDASGVRSVTRLIRAA